MEWVLVIILVIVILVITGVKNLPNHLEDVQGPQYQMLGSLFTPAERSFLGILKLALNDEADVFGKVRVADVITPKKGQQRSEWQKAFNKISSKHFDFIVCNKEDLTPICVIELNDSSHNSKKRQERDRFLEEACKSAKLSLLQVPAKATYNVQEIRELLIQYIPKIPCADNIKINLGKFETDQSSRMDKVCPKCSSAMTLKIAKRGKNSGNEFWGCSAFPKCRYLESK